MRFSAQFIGNFCIFYVGPQHMTLTFKRHMLSSYHTQNLFQNSF